MLEKNTIYCCDVLDGLSRLDDESIDLIITSPPYNKMGLNGFQKSTRRKWFTTIDYNGDRNVDNMDETLYEEWQVKVLNECYRVLKPEGSMFYNHKNRIVARKGEIITPYQWLFKTDFKIRQEITWDRTSTCDVNKCRYWPTTEKIFWLAKSNKPSFSLNATFYNEVWRFSYKTHTEHPAPFPITLPDNIIPSVAQGKRITVLDPFMGSGTVAMSAVKNGCDYIGFELFQSYVDMANKNLETL